MRNKVIEIIKENCKQKQYDKNSAVAMSEQLHLSRNEVATLLKDLWNQHLLIKVESKPIVYLDKAYMESILDKTFDETKYESLADVFEQKSEVHDFEKLVGYDESLHELVKQCKATISYPPKGLPMMLYGPTGTGKSYIAKLTYEYAKNQGLLKKEGKFIAVNCSEYANNPELLTANLFGHVKGAFTGADKDNPGLIALADGGVLFLDEVHNLKAECQEKLFLFMDQAIFHRVGDNEKWYESNVRIIFATTENPEVVLLKTLQRRIPMTIHVPSLEERGLQERVQLLYTMFKEEEKRLNKKIKISAKVYNMLLSYHFVGNIGGLKSCVQSCCVNALFNTNEQDEMLIHLNSMPKAMLEEYSSKKQAHVAHNEYLDVADLQGFIHKEKEIIQLNEALLKIYQDYRDNKINKEATLHQQKQSIREYFDHVLFKKDEIKDQSFYQNGVQYIFDLIASRYGLKVQNNDLLAISAYLSDYSKNYHSFRNYVSKHKEDCFAYLQFMKEEYYREYSVVSEISKYLASYLDMDILAMVDIFLLIFIKSVDKDETKRKRIAIILAHGFSTASSIADATNKFLGKYIFDAIDMPLNVDTNTIIQKLNIFLSRIGKVEEILLLVDMGSLEEIYKGLEVKNANVGIINNISTKAALGIGNGILQNKAMEDIFQEVIEYSGTSYHIEKHRLKEEIILCSCASGIGTAEKLRKIIQDSLPVNIGISVKTYNYNELIEKGCSDAFFDDYHVLCVIGTLNPNIDELNFIGIEDLIINDCLDDMDTYLKANMNEEQLAYFKKNILKNFSLSNIMNNLTILNPNKLLEHVADAIDRLQTILNLKLSNNTCFGLYVHISCLIERLVMQKGIAVYHNLDDFQKENQVFIEQVKTTFKEVEEFYGVEISIAEIGYIYDYIVNDDKF
ncbi:MAG: PRD domain-containing protein [Erysipelotrichia bacterium]|nr:PRD domain-containing protein [Erysipelotrichia bacterium]NCC54141.1 PRD domain-containing protein [Erysipelotrichia bacterium]